MRSRRLHRAKARQKKMYTISKWKIQNRKRTRYLGNIHSRSYVDNWREERKKKHRIMLSPLLLLLALCDAHLSEQHFCCASLPLNACSLLKCSLIPQFDCVALKSQRVHKSNGCECPPAASANTRQRRRRHRRSHHIQYTVQTRCVYFSFDTIMLRL